MNFNWKIVIDDLIHATDTTPNFDNILPKINDHNRNKCV